MIIVSVLRQSKDFTAKHAQWLSKQIKGHRFICLTDAKHIPGVETAPLLYDWPGWWAKIELFNPNHPIIGKEDILYFDIDTVITGDISELAKVKNFTMLNDFLEVNSEHPAPASGVMFIPADKKHLAWEKFNSDPDAIINSNCPPPYHGDQGFIGSVYKNADRWQNILPRKIISYKVDIATKDMIGFNPSLSLGSSTGKVPLDAVVVCFHGNPRPWKTGFSWVPTFSLKEKVCGKLKGLKLKLKSLS